MSAADVFLYRDGRRVERTEHIRHGLAAAVDLALGEERAEARRRAWVRAAILCGELEAAVADLDHPSRRVVARLTDTLAAAATGAASGLALAQVSRRLAIVDLPSAITVSSPEGFAYYGLQPEACAGAVRDLRAPDGALVIGVRSIGTTLAAFTSEALRARGVTARRITVRPTGEPFDRTLALSTADRDEVLEAARSRAEVIIVDEGPGLSGSTLLATIDAVVALGVARPRITVVCSRAFSPASLRAPAAEARWRGIRVQVLSSDVRPPPAGEPLSGGSWRARHYAHEDEWPAVWPEVERQKCLVERDGLDVLCKYEGQGSGAERARERAEILADAGLSLAPLEDADGWLSYPWVGTPLRGASCDRTTIEMLARYCAARLSLFAETTGQSCGPMAAKNLLVLLGPEARCGEPRVERPVVPDGRMQPHEFVREARGRVWKVDGNAHGDDHFFPGTTDIAWDLAGVIVEWSLDEEGKSHLLDRYARLSGDRAAPRIDPWVVAYGVFRAAFTAHAHDTTSDLRERDRLAADRDRYLRVTRDALGRQGLLATG